MAKTPLKIVVLHHPESATSKELARGIYQRFMATGGSPGIRIPVSFGEVRADRHPPRVDLGEARHTIVVALMDERIARRAEEKDCVVADAWGQRLHELHEKANGAHAFLPVAVDTGGMELDARFEKTSFIRLDRPESEPSQKTDKLAFQIGVAALRLLAEKGASKSDGTRLQMFVSHAKKDLPPKDVAGPAKEILARLSQGPIDGWYDEKKIKPGERFDIKLSEGVGDSDVLVCVLTDDWSDREWCRRELMMAKQAGIPIVIIDAIEEEVPLMFPYVGNARTLRWRPNRPQPLVLAVVLEALKHRHAVEVLNGRKQHPTDVVRGSSPEGLTLRMLPKGTECVLYPDPPLPNDLNESLQPAYVFESTSSADPAGGAVNAPLVRMVEFTTPLKNLARWREGASGKLIGLSLSGATDIDQWGASKEHLATFADDLVTMLLVAGLRVGYGGVLDHGGTGYDSINYTRRLFELVHSYSPLAKQASLGPLPPIENFVPWPDHVTYGDEEKKKYGQEARLKRGPPPDGVTQEDLQAGEAVRRWARARGLTAMREHMNENLHARIALGGKLRDYSGLIPGVLEEILMARTGLKKIPVYLLGAFGGAARMAIDLLEGRPRPEATTAWVEQNVEKYRGLVAQYRAHGNPFDKPEEYAARLADLGASGPARALENGLSDEENRELFMSTDVYRLVELILVGLRKVTHEGQSS